MYFDSFFARDSYRKAASFWQRVAVLLLLCSLASLSGCKGGGGNGGNGSLVNVAGIDVAPNPAFITVGGSVQYTATVKDPTGNVVNGLTVIWSSSATNVATINSNGLATGVATGMTQVMASVQNGTTAFSVPLTVNPALAVTSTELPLGALNIPYIATSLSTMGVRKGGVGPFTWSIANGTALPVGLSMNSSGTISGTPTLTGSPSFTVQITDSETPPVSKQANFSITVVDSVNSPCNIITSNNPGILNGSYAFLLQGFQAGTANGTPVAMAGSFAADGTGKITGGEEDLNLAAGPQHLTINGGSYAVNTSGQGCVQFKYSNNTASVFHFALSLTLNGGIATHGRIIEFDAYEGLQGGAATKLASGVMLLQNASEFTASLASRFAFGQDGVDSSGGHLAIAGSFSLDSSGNITNLAEDVDDAGATNSITGQTGKVSSTATTAATGRATVAVTITGVGTLHEASYIVNKNELFLVSIDPLEKTTPIYSGRAILTASSYSASSLLGNYVFHATGIDKQGDGAACAASAPCALVEVGVANANGTSALTGTVFVSQAGTSQSVSLSNTYSVDAATGRVKLTQAGGGQPPVLYLATPQTGTDATESMSAFIVGSGGDPTALFGFAETQPNGPFSLNSPPPYIVGTEDGGEIDANFLAGNVTFASGMYSTTRDISSIAGLFFAASTNFTLSVNSDGTLSGSQDGATNSTSNTPGKAFIFPPMGSPAFIRVSES